MQQLRWFVPIEKCDCCFDNQVRIDYWPEARVGLLSPEEASIVGDRMGIGAKTLVTGDRSHAFGEGNKAAPRSG